jgi:hypothetical protein
VVLGVALVACGRGDGAGSSGSTGATATGGTPASGTSGATAPATGTTSSGPTGPSGSPAPGTDLADGRHFGYVRSIDPLGLIVFDLAYFLTGDEATRAAREHGDEAPPPNDYYIVNDNPRLRTLTLEPGVRISLLDWNRCCDRTVDIDVPTWIDVLGSRGDGLDVDGALLRGDSPVWITISGGVVAAVEEQYLP